MLRMLKKLALRRNTIRTLTDTDLTLVDGAGGDITTCTAQTRDASTCVAPMEPVKSPPGTK